MITIDIFLQTVIYLGFEEVYRETFNTKETFFIFARWDGLLLSFDTFTVNNHVYVNGGDLYYNWKPKEHEGHGKYLSSSSCHDILNPTSGNITDIPRDRIFYVGEHHVNNLEYDVKQLEIHGTFISPWIKEPFLWLLPYTEDKDRRERIALLPDWVKKMIGCKQVENYNILKFLGYLSDLEC